MSTLNAKLWYLFFSTQHIYLTMSFSLHLFLAQCFFFFGVQIILIDLILQKPKAYRHILYNVLDPHTGLIEVRLCSLFLCPFYLNMVVVLNTIFCQSNIYRIFQGLLWKSCIVYLLLDACILFRLFNCVFVYLMLNPWHHPVQSIVVLYTFYGDSCI